MKCWAQTWTESERGWGNRPDGYTLHVHKADIALFLQDMRAGETALGYGEGCVPDEYSYPDGNPTLVEITDPDIITRLQASTHGIWGPGKNPPPPLGVAEEPAIPLDPRLKILYQVRALEEQLYEALRPTPRTPPPPSPPPIRALQGDDNP